MKSLVEMAAVAVRLYRTDGPRCPTTSQAFANLREQCPEAERVEYLREAGMPRAMMERAQMLAREGFCDKARKELESVRNTYGLPEASELDSKLGVSAKIAEIVEERRRQALGRDFAAEIAECIKGRAPEVAVPHVEQLLGIFDGNSEKVLSLFDDLPGNNVRDFVVETLGTFQASACATAPELLRFSELSVRA